MSVTVRVEDPTIAVAAPDYTVAVTIDGTIVDGPPAPVTSVNGEIGDVILTAADLDAVSVHGDTMDGDLRIEKTNAALGLREPGDTTDRAAIGSAGLVFTDGAGTGTAGLISLPGAATWLTAGNAGVNQSILELVDASGYPARLRFGLTFFTDTSVADVIAFTGTDPNGVGPQTTAKPGSLALASNGTHWVKATGTDDTGWVQLLDATTATGLYLPLAGGTLTGDLAIEKAAPQITLRHTGDTSDRLTIAELGFAITAGDGTPWAQQLAYDANWILAADSTVFMNTAGTGNPILGFQSGQSWRVVSGSPEGGVSALVGSYALDDTGAFWFKAGGGSGNTGWVQLLDSTTAAGLYLPLGGGTLTGDLTLAGDTIPYALKFDHTNPVVNNDYIGRVQFGGNDGTGVRQNGAVIHGYASGTWSPTSTPGYLWFGTTPPGGTGQNVRMVIRDTGLVVVGFSNATAGTVEKFRVNDPTAVDNDAATMLAAAAATDVPLVVQGTTGQTGDLQRWKTAAGQIAARATLTRLAKRVAGDTDDRVWLDTSPGIGTLRFGDGAGADWAAIYGYTSSALILATAETPGTVLANDSAGNSRYGLGVGSRIISHFPGSPEGNLAADTGSLCCDTTTGHWWRKATGVGITGWVDTTPDTGLAVVDFGTTEPRPETVVVTVADPAVTDSSVIATHISIDTTARDADELEAEQFAVAVVPKAGVGFDAYVTNLTGGAEGAYQLAYARSN